MFEELSFCVCYNLEGKRDNAYRTTNLDRFLDLKYNKHKHIWMNIINL